MSAKHIIWTITKNNENTPKNLKISMSSVIITKKSIPEVAQLLGSTIEKVNFGIRDKKLVASFGTYGYKFQNYSTFIQLGIMGSLLRRWFRENNITLGIYLLSYIGDNMYECTYSEELSHL